MSTVMLTGATGFVGRAIHRYLAQAGHTVRAPIRSGSEGRLAEPAQTIETIDIFAHNPQWWAETCEGVDAVIHAACHGDPAAAVGLCNLEKSLKFREFL